MLGALHGTLASGGVRGWPELEVTRRNWVFFDLLCEPIGAVKARPKVATRK